jgi:hypothetical protein
MRVKVEIVMVSCWCRVMIGEWSYSGWVLRLVTGIR